MIDAQMGLFSEIKARQIFMGLFVAILLKAPQCFFEGII